MDIPIATDTLAKYIAGIGLALMIAGGLLGYNTYLIQAEERIKVDALGAKYDWAWNIRAGRPVGKLCLASDSACIAEQESLQKAEESKQIEDYTHKKETEEDFQAHRKIWNIQFILGGIVMLLGAVGTGWGLKGWRDAERKDKATA